MEREHDNSYYEDEADEEAIKEWERELDEEWYEKQSGQSDDDDYDESKSTF